MKVKTEIDENISECEIVIKCSEENESINALRKMISNYCGKTNISFYKDNTEYFIKLSDVLFFETDGALIDAHTRDDVFHVKNKLYELEEILPGNFFRISKSTIVNISHIYSVTRSITSSKTIQFYNSKKQVYVSRSFQKALSLKLNERKNNYE